jgi:hypothetical protein
MDRETLKTLHAGACDFLRARRTPGKPFGHFKLCAHAFADDELSALCVGLELWKLLGLELDECDLDHAVARMAAMRNPHTGLLADPAWRGRLPAEAEALLRDGDSFFTRSAVCALRAWERPLPGEIAVLRDLDAGSLPGRVRWERGGHDLFAVGDLAVLLLHNAEVGVAGAGELHRAFLAAAAERQDPGTGLWLQGDPRDGLTPSINLTFHTVKFAFNAFGQPLPRAEAIIDSCLSAARDERYYSWENGYACNDLDLALVLYSAARCTGHRREEIAVWARERLPLILRVRKPDGGFSFYHERAMERHYLLRVSPGEAEGDLWGTLMYLGTVHMMVRLGYPDLEVPWTTSEVHKVVPIP